MEPAKEPSRDPPRAQGWQGRGGAGGAGRKKSATPAGARGAAKRPGAHVCLYSVDKSRESIHDLP